jgi:hypothetical protein
MGSTLFVGLRGTIDLRLRFHKTEDEFLGGKLPTNVAGAQAVIMANLSVSEPDGTEAVIAFLMDENDLSYMKKFVRNMERELKIGKSMVNALESQTNAGR